MSHEGYFNIVNASRNYLYAADGNDHTAEARSDVSDTSTSLYQKKFWWKLEAIPGEMDDGKQCYHIINEEYGYLFAMDKKTKDRDHRVVARQVTNKNYLKDKNFKWTISKRDRRLDWSNVNNLAYGRMFAAGSETDGGDHIIECRPSGDSDELKFRWFFLDQLSLDNWMQHIADTHSLATLTIPGTHDSGTTGLLSGAGRTQSLSMTEQLRMGARFIDCRLVIRGLDPLIPSKPFSDPSDLIFAHDIIPITNLTFVDFIKDTLIAFLKTHPKECVILSIHDEFKFNFDWEQTIFATLVSKVIHAADTASYWYTENRIPLLREVRGKIVLMRRYSTSDTPNTGTDASAHGSIGINARNGWKDNQAFAMTNGDVALNVQDNYEIPNKAAILSTKWPAVRGQLHAARTAYDAQPMGSTLYLNFLSSVGPKSNAGIPTSWQVAEEIGSQTLSYLEKSEHRRQRYGVIIGDYVTANLKAAIIANNF